MDEKRFSLEDIIKALDEIVEDGIEHHSRQVKRALINGYLTSGDPELKDIIISINAIKSLRKYLPEKLGFEFTREVGECGFKEDKWVYKGDTRA